MAEKGETAYESVYSAESGGYECSESKHPSGWKTLLESMISYDDKMIGDWKDELANLLTFTGLFSAVVTAFVAISIPDLKEDHTERSAQLLERISMQLSVAPGTLNASSLPSPPPFTADIEDVRINALWVTSLTLSLMAAFFTITAQQWIRHLPLPREMSIQDSVRLRQFRHDGMVKWQIPTIISLLPVLVQLSVISFLAGLLLYLRSINQAVAVIFAAITGPLVFCFVIASLCPIIWPSCPYKSPLIPTIWTIVQWCIVPVLVAGGVLVCALLLVILATVSIFWYIAFARFSVFKLIQKPLNDFASWYNVLQDEVTVRLYHAAQRISSGPLHYDTEHFWTSREWAAIRKCPSLIDVLAFAWAPIGVPTNGLKDVALCLRDLPKSERVRSALRWAALELDCFPFDFNMWFSMQYPFHPRILSLVRRQSFLRLQAVLMAAFAPDPPGIDENISYNWPHMGGPVQPMSALACCFLIGPNQDRGDASGASALTLLYRTTTELQPDELAQCIAKDDKHRIAQTNRNESLESFTRTVMGLRRCQYTDAMADLHWRWPTVFLYLCAERNFIFDEDDMLQLFNWTVDNIQCIDAVKQTGKDIVDSTQHFAVFDCIVGSLATALLAVANHPSPTITQSTQFRDALGRLRELFQEVTREQFQIFGGHCAYNDRDIPSFVTPRALASMPLSLSTLRAQECLTDDLLEDATAIVQAILAIAAPVPKDFPGVVERADAFFGASSPPPPFVQSLTGLTLPASDGSSDLRDDKV